MYFYILLFLWISLHFLTDVPTTEWGRQSVIFCVVFSTACDAAVMPLFMSFRLCMPKSRTQEYLSHLGKKVLASFPIQATLHFYNDESSSEEEEE